MTTPKLSPAVTRLALSQYVTDLAVAVYRHLHPESRTETVCAYTVNSGTRRRRDCRLCGAMGVSWCGDYRRTVQSVKWEEGHEEECAARYLDAHADLAQQVQALALGIDRGAADVGALAVAYYPQAVAA